MVERKEEPRGESRIFKDAGINVSFSDQVSADAFDMTIEICQEAQIPLEIGFIVLCEEWLETYLRAKKSSFPQDYEEELKPPARETLREAIITFWKYRR